MKKYQKLFGWWKIFFGKKNEVREQKHHIFCFVFWNFFGYRKWVGASYVLHGSDFNNLRMRQCAWANICHTSPPARWSKSGSWSCDTPSGSSLGWWKGRGGSTGPDFGWFGRNQPKSDLCRPRSLEIVFWGSDYLDPHKCPLSISDPGRTCKSMMLVLRPNLHTSLPAGLWDNPFPIVWWNSKTE